jgi:hypothetical protein
LEDDVGEIAVMNYRKAVLLSPADKKALAAMPDAESFEAQGLPPEIRRPRFRCQRLADMGFLVADGSGWKKNPEAAEDTPCGECRNSFLDQFNGQTLRCRFLGSYMVGRNMTCDKAVPKCP